MPTDSTPLRVTGSCLCAKVQYAADGPFPDFRYCHCQRCQKFTGSAFSSSLWVPKERFFWTEGEADTISKIFPDLENYARRFCRHCGGPVPKLAKDGIHMVIPAGTLDVDPIVCPTKSIFWKLRACWFVNPCELPKFEERPAK